MPTVKEAITTEVEIEFELWCSICGNGICGNTKYKKNSKNEFYTFCDKCKEDKEQLENRCSELEDENTDLKNEIISLQKLVDDTAKI